MTTNSPQEAARFRGKTLTPESPVPVHIPEPQNIPVLVNQIDPSFNDMSTHMEHRYPIQASNLVGTEVSHQQTSTMISPNVEQSYQANGSQNDGDNKAGENKSPVAEGSLQDSNGNYQQEVIEKQHEHDTSQDLLTATNAQPAVSNGTYDSLSTDTKNFLASFSPSQNLNPSAITTQDVTASSFQSPKQTPASQDTGAPAPQTLKESDARSQASDSDANGEGVNYQALLDNLSPSTSTAPASENIASITTAAPPGSASPSSIQTPIATLPVPAGLPPRPPPQEKPAIHHNYTPGEDIRTYHNPPPQSSAAQTSYTSQSSNSHQPPRGYIHTGGVAPNGMPPPPIATFQQPLSTPNTAQPSPQDSQTRQRDNYASETARQRANQRDGDDEYPRRPEVEKIYEEFLREEAIYVAEGTWDRFPQGSRLFVGNLFTEQVTKRDIFYVFHKYGRLAQISMKSAYGFVQYHDSQSCMRALQSEQGIEIRGRKINLEISKPQKNSRNAAATAQGDSLRAGYSRRSRSPDYTRGGAGYGGAQRSSGDRYDRNPAPVAFERRVRDDYRPGMRSVSPRGYRDYRGNGRSPDRYYRGRSRSPGYDRNGRYRSRSPMGLDPDDEANLPIMRRNPRDVPDVQIVLVDEVDRTFVGYIQQSFRDRSLRCDVLQLPRVSLAAVVKRQVVEGVQAVVKIFRKSQNTGKIPLQVYNRSGGADNVRFDDYEDLDANIAAELVVRAKTTHMAPAPAPPQYPPAPRYEAPQYHQPMQQPPPHQPIQPPQSHMPMQQQQHPPPQGGGQPQNLANLITSLDAPSLQKLLSTMSQTPQTPSNPQQHMSPHQQQGQTQDLSSLLQSVSQHQQPPPQQHQQQPQQQQAYQYNQQYSARPPQQQQQQHAYAPPVAAPTYNGNPNAGYGARPPQQQGYPGPPQQQQQGQQHNVQDMLAQLARYKP